MDITEGTTDIILDLPTTNLPLETYYIFAYLKAVNEPVYVPIPGAVKELDRKFLFYYTDIQIYIGVSNFDGSDLTKGWIANAGINELHLLFVEISNLTGKTQEDFKTSLKKTMSRNLQIFSFTLIVSSAPKC